MKFLYSYFFPETGESTVALSDKNGVYIGTAKLHPQDKEFASEYAGCRLAQKRAWIQYLQRQLRIKKIQLKTIKNLIKDINLNCNSIDPKIQRRFNLKLRDYTNEIQELTNNINLLNEEIKKDIKIRDSLIERTKIAKNTE